LLYALQTGGHQVWQVGFLQVLWFPPTQTPVPTSMINKVLPVVL